MQQAKTKLVNGVRVELTSAESAAIEAEWAANDEAAANAPPPPPTLEEEITALKTRLDRLESRGVFDNNLGHILDNALNPVYEV